ncbi:fatty acid desaturase [Actinomarinicola tropica]|uniref:fatty acid desaturase n=1 Tax=Actinomarinicola tropica TaxID=2789776 RepID=UPI00189AF2CB|nr:fatty acid desaturase [Actinomarinicola tropica]
MTLAAAAPETDDGSTTREGREGAGSLLPVIRAIPPEAYDNPTWRGLAYVLRDLAVYAAAVAGLLLTNHPLVVVPLWVLAGLAISGLFVVGHDAAHGALFASKRLNGVVGRLAMLPSFHVYEGWILGHNRVHHQYTVRQGFDFVWHPYTAEQYRAMSRFQRLRHRFEWSWLGAGAYYTREVWWNRMMVGEVPKRFVEPIHRDRRLVWSWFVVVVAATAAFGWVDGGSLLAAVWTPVKVVVVPFLAFQFIIGSVVHVHHIAPDIRWWPRREWTKFKGQMEGTTILRAAPGLNLFFHWIMVHIPHHVDVRIPMYRLELAAEAIKEAFPDTVHDEKLRFRDFIANTRVCKLYDFEAGHWLSYREALAEA